MIVLINITRKANIIYWFLTKCKRIIRSILAIKLYGIAHSFNVTAAIKSIINKMLSIIILLILYTNLKLYFNCLVRPGTIQNKYLIINIIYLH